VVKVECGARLIQVPGMKNQNTGVNILYGELSVRICDPIQNSAPRIPLVFDFYLPDTCKSISRKSCRIECAGGGGYVCDKSTRY